MADSVRDITYVASPTMAKFHASDAPLRGTMGPFGSGKSVAMSAEIMRRAQEQARDKRGLRCTRWAVVRNTYRELRDTTLKTWLDWFPEELFGSFNYSNMEHNISFGDVRMEVLFRALDRPGHLKKLLSMELTGAWVNEAREVPKVLIDGLIDRSGRYPAIKNGTPPTWNGVIMDTNPPDSDHWWYAIAERDPEQLQRMHIDPDTLTGWEFFRQPGGLVERDGKFWPNPLAENTHNLEPGYYIKRIAGKSADYIRVYYCAQYGYVMDGKPVIHEYSDALHCTGEDIRPVPGVDIVVGLDFGLTPAALFMQALPNGRVVWIDELVSEDMGVKRFAEVLQRKMSVEYDGFQFASPIWGDPAGMQRSQVDERTPFQILRAAGIDARPAPSNDFTLRREAIAAPLCSIIDGKPGLLVSTRCPIARKGLMGGYAYKRLQVAGDERFKDVPDKSKYSHVVEAGGYAMLGAGFGRKLIRKERSAPLQNKADMKFRFNVPGMRDVRQTHAD